MAEQVSARDILEDLVKKYGMLSRRIDSSFGRASASQLIRQMDALTRIAKLILSYRSVLEMEERERELTRILSEIRGEIESGKRAMTARKDGEDGFRIIERLLAELRRLKHSLMGVRGDE